MKKSPLQKQNSGDIQEYVQFLEHVKTDILQTQIKAASAVTTELILLYWRIGQSLSAKTKENNWGRKAIDALAQDLKKLFPNLAEKPDLYAQFC